MRDETERDQGDEPAPEEESIQDPDPEQHDPESGPASGDGSE